MDEKSIIAKLNKVILMCKSSTYEKKSPRTLWHVIVRPNFIGDLGVVFGRSEFESNAIICIANVFISNYLSKECTKIVMRRSK